MLLIYPPVSKPCEPPAGVAGLSGALRSHGVRHTVFDANLEGLLCLAGAAVAGRATGLDTWTSRALRNCAGNIRSLRDMRLYRSADRYRRAVKDLNRVLERSVDVSRFTLGLANYQDCRLSPVRSRDLLAAAEAPEANPFYPFFSRRLEALIAEKQPRVVGFSINYLSQALCAFAMMGFIRRAFPGLDIVCGGGLVTSWLRRPCRHDCFGGLIDRLVAGPGEEALLRLAGVDERPAAHYTPCYEQLPVSDYLSPGAILPYSGASGCFWNRCSFCPEKAEGGCYTPVGIRQAREDLSLLSARMNPSMIHLLDNAVSPALMRSLLDDPPGAAWYGFARITGDLADPDYCMALKRSGCAMLKLGIESGDQAVLDRMNKGVDLGDAARALKALKQAGIATYVYLLFGSPEEDLEGARKTLAFTARHAGEIGFLNLAIFNMPVGSASYGELRRSDFYEGDLSLYTDFERSDGWDRRAVRRFIEREFRKDRAVADILGNEPPFFTSNHAAFFQSRRGPSGLPLAG
jgi:hypothetical protein